MITVILAILSAVLYTLGGAGAGRYHSLPSWLKDSKARDFGVPLCMVAWMAFAGQLHWTLILCFGLLFGSLTTYFKKKGENAKWFNWLFCGLAYSVAMIPFVIANGLWLPFIYRTIVLSAFTIIWSEGIGLDWIEEGGRGFGIIVTLPILLI